MDHKAALLIESYQNSKLTTNNDDDNGEISSEDELIDLLEDDDDALARYRDIRIQQMKNEFLKINNTTDRTEKDNIGRVTSCADEKSVMDVVTNNEVVLVHFYQPGFKKCQAMNEKLEVIAEKHLALRILKIQAQEAPFLVTKLNVKVLPLVVIYKNSKELTRIVGFERLGSNLDDFAVEALEQLLLSMNIINRRAVNFASIRSKNQANDCNGSDDDDDWD